MAKLVLADVTNILGNPTSAANTLNSNNTLVEAALEKTLSRDGTAPNQMLVDFDMNNNDILNVNDLQVESILLNGELIVPSGTVSLPAAVMTKPVYDPNGVEDDAFDLSNHTGTISQTQLAAGAVDDSKLETGSAVSNRVLETISPFDPTYGALGGSNDDRVAVQAAWDAGSANKTKVVMSRPLRIGGQLTTDDDLEVHWNNGAWTYQTGFSATGSFIQNLRPNSSAAASIQSNILLVNPQIDGSLFPDPVPLEVASSTANTVTFTAAASPIDGFYVGFILEDVSGANTGGLRIVTGYVGATRTATHTTAWVVNPSAGNIILAGWNDNGGGFAAGMSDVTIDGGFIKNYQANRMVPSATGGKGWNFEQGVTNGRMTNLRVEDCGTSFFVQGVDGAFANGAKRRTSPIQLTGLSAKNVGSLVTLAGLNSAASPDGDADDSMIVVTDVTYENAGHSPWRIVPSDHQKSGILNFLEAQNVIVSNIRGRNDGTYPSIAPGYPTDYAARCGFGLTGSIGAMIWGHGRNLRVDGFVHSGNVDNVIVVRRGRALGDDAGPTGAPRNCFNWQFKGIEHHGVINEYVIRIDPTVGFRVAAGELTGNIEVSVNGGFVTLGLVDPNMASFTTVTLTINDHVGGQTIIGTPAQIFAAGNTFASFGTGTTDLRKVDRRLNSVSIIKTATIADDSVFSWTVPAGATSFELLLHNGSSSGRGVLSWNGTDWSIATQPAAVIETSTSVLTGTTGTDVRLTVSKNGTTIYVENRLGAPYSLYAIPKYYG